MKKITRRKLLSVISVISLATIPVVAVSCDFLDNKKVDKTKDSKPSLPNKEPEKPKDTSPEKPVDKEDPKNITVPEDPSKVTPKPENPDEHMHSDEPVIPPQSVKPVEPENPKNPPEPVKPVVPVIPKNPPIIVPVVPVPVVPVQPVNPPITVPVVPKDPKDTPLPVPVVPVPVVPVPPANPPIPKNPPEPVKPVVPVQPVNPPEPVKPVVPKNPKDPVISPQPVKPVKPDKPQPKPQPKPDPVTVVPVTPTLPIDKPKPPKGDVEALPPKPYVSNLGSGEISNVDPNPENINDPSKIFINVANNYIVKAKLPKIKSNFFNTTLHYVNLKGGNNFLWIANFIKTMPETSIAENSSFDPELVNDKMFDNIFENAIQFNNFEWSVQLNPLERESNDFLSSYLGTFFILSYFSDEKTFKWFKENVPDSEKTDAGYRKPTFLNSVLLDRIIGNEKFKSKLIEMFQSINYWYNKFWRENSNSFEFFINGESAGGDYALRQGMKSIDFVFDQDDSRISSDGRIYGKIKIEPSKTSIQKYIDSVVEYNTKLGNKFLGVFPLVFRNSGLIDLGNEFRLRGFTIFNWEYEKFIDDDRPSVDSDATPQTNFPKKDVFIKKEIPKDSKTYLTFKKLIKDNGKLVYKNNQSYFLANDFNEKSYSNATLEFDWNANFLFVFAKPKSS